MERLKNVKAKLRAGFEFGEKWERNFAVLLLILFIFFGVLFFIFFIPRINSGFSIIGGKGKSAAVVHEEAGPAENFSTGIRLSGSMNYSQALIYFQKAVEKDPENVNYLNELAVTHYKLKNYDEAIKVYEKLVQVDGQNESVYSNRIANMYWIRKEYDRAEAYFRKAIEKDPKSSISYNNLALMLSEENRKEDAAKVLEEGIRESGDSKDLKDTLSIIQG